jgi:predicted nuclease with RNAse H fold
MKSVGEAMAIGRTFHESMQKALASMETGLTGFDEIDIPGAPDVAAITKALSRQTPDRIRIIAQAMRHGLSDDTIAAVTRFDPWFLARIREIVETEDQVRRDGLPVTEEGIRALKMMGFTDARLAKLTGREEVEHPPRAPQPRRHRAVQAHRHLRRRVRGADALHVLDLRTPHDGRARMRGAAHGAKKVVILGGGPNRIGQGIEFDYCCCHACFALSDAGYETIMVNCNPETVSTDYDTSDRLYFEPLTFEHVMEILRVEQENGTLHGVIVQFGGQTPLKLANALHDAGIPILGTTPDAIDLAEDRERFQQLVQRLGLKQPKTPSPPPTPRPRPPPKARLPAGDPPLLRPGRPRDGDRARRRPARPLHPRCRGRLGRQPRPARQLSRRRDGGRCRRPLRRRERPCRGHHAAYRGGGRAFRRQRLFAAAPHAADRDPGRDHPPDRGARQGAQRRGPDERAVRGERPGLRGRDLPDRGEPPRLPHRALRGQGDRFSHRLHRRAAHGGREALRLPRRQDPTPPWTPTPPSSPATRCRSPISASPGSR